MPACLVHNVSRKSRCRHCPDASGICTHGYRRGRCATCSPSGYLAHLSSVRIRQALKGNKSKRAFEYLGCNISEFKKHIEDQFTGDMSWENHALDTWHVDHIIGIQYKGIDGKAPTADQVLERLHYTNCQPMLASNNMSKGARYCGKYNSDFSAKKKDNI